MILYSDYKKKEREYYKKMLEIIGSLSRLFSESDIPYLDSRVAENLYCKSFNAINKSRDDSSADAVSNKTGIGIKTFAGKSAQKIAEFNKDILTFNSLLPLEKAKRIAELRNKRIEFTKRTYAVDYMKYHCIIREKGKMLICEEPMELINLENLKLSKSTPKSLSFKDGKNEYNFNVSKSVLLKKFKRTSVAEVKVEILENPFDLLDKTLTKQKKEVLRTMKIEYQYIVLPLYALEKKVKAVPERSGLNQWNARGRARDKDEVYIKVPTWIHQNFPGFFPRRDTEFELKLPNGEYLSTKICQDGDKALMSNPNKALGKWILRDVLALKKGKLLTYKMLQEMGIDSVIIKKTGKLKYEIDFREEGEFEKFEENKNKAQ